MKAHRRQRGVAIITALVVVAAVTVAVAGMLWRQALAVRKLENQNALDQARWLGRSALEWSRLILMQDARTSAVDHNGELWAVPLADTPVARRAFNGASGSARNQPDDAVISGRIVDAQARFNLSNLIAPPPASNQSGPADPYDPQALVTLRRLLDLLDQPKEAALTIASRMVQHPRPLDFDDLANALIRQQRLQPQVLAALRPYVTVLPKPAPVNFNTASPEVMAAMIAKLSLSQARTLASSRDRIYFNQVSDVLARLPEADTAAASAAHISDAVNRIAVSSHYFEVQGLVRYGRAEYGLRALLERDNGGLSRIVNVQEP